MNTVHGSGIMNSDFCPRFTPLEMVCDRRVPACRHEGRHYALGRLQGCQRRLSHMNTLLRLFPLPIWDILGLTLAGH